LPVARGAHFCGISVSTVTGRFPVESSMGTDRIEWIPRQTYRTFDAFSCRNVVWRLRALRPVSPGSLEEAE
jgi:hypothetical protein